MTIGDPISIRKAGRQHMCNQSQHTEGQRSKRERKNKWKAMVLIRNWRFAQQEPH